MFKLKPPTDKQTARGPRQAMPRWLPVVLCLNSLLLSIFLLHSRFAHRPVRPHPSPLASARRPSGHMISEGPWGRLEFTRAWIEVPEDFLPNIEELNDVQVEWFIPSHDPTEVRNFFTEAGLVESQCDELLDESSVRTDTDGTIIIVAPSILSSLSAPVRRKLYVRLGQFERNEWYHQPARHHKDRFEEWFQDSGLSPKMEHFIRKHCYRNGNAFCFSDFSLLMQKARTSEERMFLVKFLSRKSVLLGRLKIPPGEEVRQVANYWARGRHRTEILHMIQTCALRPGGDTIDLSLVLPPFARKHIYTYPYPEIEMRREVQNCFWTAAHFDAGTFRHELHQAAAFQAMLQADYEPVIGERSLGDLLAFFDPHGNLIHAAVYVAADAAYTKNGWYHTMPWCLMSVQDLQSFYSIRGVVMYTYRRRSSPKPTPP